MSYMERLKHYASQNSLPDALTKPTEPGFVSFVSDPSRRVCGKGAMSGADNATSTHVPPLDIFELPAALAAGLERLRTLPPLRTASPMAWSRIIADAQQVADHGWAAQALQLGWVAVDLFGVSADPDWMSLAVWLAGRRLVLIDERTAIAAVGIYRYVYNRRCSDEAVLPWSVAPEAS
jgi:hypothetical protein